MFTEISKRVMTEEEVDRMVDKEGIQAVFKEYQRRLAEIPFEERAWSLLVDLMVFAVGEDKWWTKRGWVSQAFLVNALGVLTVEEREKLFYLLPEGTCKKFLDFVCYCEEKNKEVCK